MTTYRISQLAERAGIRATTLRFYEQAGLLPARRSESGYRSYGADALPRLAFIRSAKRLGLPLAEIRDLLGVWDEGRCAEVRRRLRPLVVTRIAEAGRRTAELGAFADRLRHALADIDGPPRPGPCAPGCGCVDDAGPAPETIACTLSADDLVDRVRDWRRLGDQALRLEHVGGGLRITLPSALAGVAAELAAAEQRCCPFFAFTLRFAGAHVHLEVQAPAEAAALLSDVLVPQRKDATDGEQRDDRDDQVHDPQADDVDRAVPDREQHDAGNERDHHDGRHQHA